MTLEQAIYERLLDIAPLTALVGTRIYQLKLPQKPTLPAVRLQRLPGMGSQHLRGPDGLLKTRIQVDAYQAETGEYYTGVTAIAAAIRGDGLGTSASGLWGWVGVSGGSPAQIRVRNVELLHDGQPELEAGELRLIRLRQDFMVHWSGM
jgi:hypothetical protein